VDVGCGTGAYGRVIAEGLSFTRGGRLIGIDRNGELLASARRITKHSDLSKIVSFKKGDARSIPLPDNFADRVVGQAFLYLFDDANREKAISEMIRVCKPGGLVSANEGAVDSHLVYVEDNPRLTKLWKKHNEALIIGFKKYHGIDRNIGYKLPSIFKKLGLQRVRLDVLPDVSVLFDDRIPIQHKKDILEY
jgi:ubiquinone/menaquinone biosynthesis C-methylase UbiE